MWLQASGLVQDQDSLEFLGHILGPFVTWSANQSFSSAHDRMALEAQGVMETRNCGAPVTVTPQEECCRDSGKDGTPRGGGG